MRDEAEHRDGDAALVGLRQVWRGEETLLLLQPQAITGNFLLIHGTFLEAKLERAATPFCDAPGP